MFDLWWSISISSGIFDVLVRASSQRLRRSCDNLILHSILGKRSVGVVFIYLCKVSFSKRILVL